MTTKGVYEQIYLLAFDTHGRFPAPQWPPVYVPVRRWPGTCRCQHLLFWHCRGWVWNEYLHCAGPPAETGPSAPPAGYTSPDSQAPRSLNTHTHKTFFREQLGNRVIITHYFFLKVCSNLKGNKCFLQMHFTDIPFGAASGAELPL